MTITDRTKVADIAQADEVMREATIKALTARGVVRPEEMLACNTPTAILAWCRWWDSQPGVGKELLADRIRSGQQPPASRKSMVDQQREYGEAISGWLRKHFPEFDRPVWGPHPAAVAAVIRLHHRHGKGRITKREHGAEIREAVAKWDRQFEQDSQSGERHEQHDNCA